MKGLILSTLSVLLLTLFIAVMPTEKEGAIYEDTVRLHILASSDTREDQELKLAVRDAVLLEYKDELSIFESVEGAKECLENKLPEIERFTDATVRSLGYDYKTKVTLSEEWYETRDYGDFSLPMGYYTSLRIIIGEGEGQNWWCVMYPPLCLDAATTESSYTEAEELLISQKYSVKFKILELIRQVSK